MNNTMNDVTEKENTYSEDVNKMSSAMEKVYNSVRGSYYECIDEDLSPVKNELDYLGKVLKTNDTQTMILVSIFGDCGYNFMSISSIAERLGLNHFEMLNLWPELDGLVEKTYLIEHHGPNEEPNYRLSSNALKAFREGKCPDAESYYELATQELKTFMDDLFRKEHFQEITNKELLTKCDTLFRRNAGSPFVLRFRDMRLDELDDRDRLLFYFILNQVLNHGKQKFPIQELSHFQRMDFDVNTSSLLKTGLVELENGALFVTLKAQMEVFQGLLEGDDYHYSEVF